MTSSLSYKITPVTAFEQNSSLIWCAKTKQAAIIDPGGDIDRLLAAVNSNELVLNKILLTHGHIDHIGFTAELARQTQVDIIGPHRDDRFLLQSLDEYGEMLSLPHSGNFESDQWLEDGDQIKLGEQVLSVIHCPGHSPGHVVYFHAQSKLAIVGDVLFHNSIGRTDLARGNHANLLSSIKNKLLPLGDDITFISGHGSNSSFGEERLHNPFLQE